LAFHKNAFLLADLRSATCTRQESWKGLIYGFDGVLIWDLYEDVTEKSLGLIYRKKSVLTGGGGANDGGY
jgi:hypothetical protein